MNRKRIFKECFFETFGDMTKKVNCNIPQKWLFEFTHYLQLNIYSEILVRDGAIGITLFFRRYPIPDGLTCKMYINYSYAKLVPKDWQKYVLYYDYESKIVVSDFDNLFIVGIPTEDSIKILLTHDLTKFNKYIFLLPNLQSADLHMAYMDYPMIERIQNSILYFQSHIEKQVVVSSVEHWAESGQFNGACVYQLVNQLEIGDNYYLHLCLEQGAQLLNNTVHHIEGQYITLSCFHGYKLFHRKSRALEDLLEVHPGLQYIYSSKLPLMEVALQDGDKIFPYDKNLSYFTSFLLQSKEDD